MPTIPQPAPSSSTFRSSREKMFFKISRFVIDDGLDLLLHEGLRGERTARYAESTRPASLMMNC